MLRFKHFLVAVAALLLAAMCTACHGDSEGASYAAFQRAPGGKWGMINMTTGEVLFEDVFDAGCQLSRGVHGVFWVKNPSGEYRLYSCEEEPRELAGPFSQVADFFDDVAPVVRTDSCITVINTKGEERFRLDKVSGKTVVSCSHFTSGVAVVQCAGGDCALIDSDGKALVPTGKYAYLKMGGDSLVLAFSQPVQDQMGCITGEGRVEVLDLRGNRVGGFDLGQFDKVTSGCTHGMLAASDANGKWGLIDSNGKWVMQAGSRVTNMFSRSNINSNADKFVFMGPSNKCGVMKTDGKVLLEDRYGGVMLNKDHFAAVELSEHVWELHNFKDKKMSGTDKYQSVLIPPGEDKLTFVQVKENDWFALDEAAHRINLEDKNGKPLKLAAVSAAMVHLEVTSEHIDMNAILDGMHLAPDGMLGMNMDMQPREAAPLLRTVDTSTMPDDTVSYPQGDEGAQHWADDGRLLIASCRMGDAAAVARVEYPTSAVTEILGIDNEPMESQLGGTVYYSHEAVLGYQYVDSIQPSSISITIEGNDILRGAKMDRLTQRLIDKVKTFGTPLASNRKAAVVAIDNDRTYLVYCENNKVTVMLLRGASTQEEAEEFLRAHPDN